MKGAEGRGSDRIHDEGFHCGRAPGELPNEVVGVQRARHQVVHERLESQLGPRHGDEAADRRGGEEAPHGAHDDAHAQGLTRVIRVDGEDARRKLQRETVDRADDATARVQHRHGGEDPRQEERPNDRSRREAQATSTEHQHEHDDREERPHEVAGAQHPPQQVRRVGHDKGPGRQVLHVLPQRPDARGGRFPPDSAAPTHAPGFPSGLALPSDEAWAGADASGAVALAAPSDWVGALGAPSLLRRRDDR